MPKNKKKDIIQVDQELEEEFVGQDTTNETKPKSGADLVPDNPLFERPRDQLNIVPEDGEPAPEETEKTEEKDKEAPGTLEPITDMDSGKQTGIRFPDGRVLMGLSPREVRGLLDNFNKKQAPLQSQDAPGTSRRATETKAQGQLAAQQLTSEGLPSPSIQLGDDARDFAATVGTSLPSIAGGATAGATAGAVIGSIIPGAGTAIGGLIGGVVGGITALLAQIAVDRRQTTKEALQVYRRSSARNTQLLNLANSGAVPPADIVAAYNQNHANILEAKRELEAQTRGAVGRQLSGAMDELIQVELYLESEPAFRLQLLNALANPNPGLVYPTQDLNIEETP